LSRNDSGIADELGSNVKFFSADVSKPAEIRSAFAEIIKWAGSIDVLINNAGFSGWQPLEKITEDFWDTMIDTNLKSVLFASQAAVAEMKAGSAIVNISSLAGKEEAQIIPFTAQVNLV